MVTIGDNRDYRRVLLYSHYTTITGSGGPPKLYRLLFSKSQKGFKASACLHNSSGDAGTGAAGSSQNLKGAAGSRQIFEGEVCLREGVVLEGVAAREPGVSDFEVCSI